MKYCSTVSPSRKFAVIGVSMISPDGFAMRPRMPASWRICCALPRAPESAIMKMGLKLGDVRSLPLSSVNLGAELAEHLVGDAVVTCAQMSTTLL
jgi:hypothetical protein